MKCVIGVVPLWDQERNSLWMIPGYLEGILRAGGLPVVLPLTRDMDLLRQLAEQMDGFLFTGGQDIDPRTYGQEPVEQCGERCPERDAMERKLFRTAVLKLNKPALGICRGLQLFNTQLGGTLYQDLPSQLPEGLEHCQSPPYHIPAHEVEILPGCVLHTLLRRERIAVNSYHHQGVRRLAGALRCAARSTDGLVEAVELPDRRFALAVQWHPEFMPEEESSALLFEALVQACRER